jgi:dolichyl-phosphate-mannose--protein O-mannosyl transferase
MLAFFALLGFYFVVRDESAWRKRLRRTRSDALVLRGWLLLAGVSLGLAASVKWSGLYFLAAFGLFTFLVDLHLRGRLGMPRVFAIGQGALNAIVLLVPAFAVYVASWLGWIIGSGGWGRNAKPSWYESLWEYHLNAYSFHTGLTSPHPYQANAFEWLLSLRPTALFFERYETSSACGWLTDCTVALTAIPNLIIWIAGLLAIIWLGFRNTRKFDSKSFAIVTGFLAGWLPWSFYLERTTFQFYAVSYAPFLVLALAFAMHAYWRKGITRRLKGRSGAIAVLISAVLIFALYFLSIWMALPVPDFVWRMQMLFPFWI